MHLTKEDLLVCVCVFSTCPTSHAPAACLLGSFRMAAHASSDMLESFYEANTHSVA